MRPIPILYQLWSIVVVIGLVSLGLLEFGRVGDPARLELADQLYGQGVELAAKEDSAGASAKFTESASVLEAELEHSDSAGMHFNRANALLQAGKLGPAIAAYRSAQLRSPADDRIAANLAEARRKVARPLSPPAPTALEYACGLWAAMSETARLCIAVAAGFAVLPTLGRRLRMPSIGLTMVAIVFAATVVADMTRRQTARIAVVSEPTVLRKGNGEGFEQVIEERLSEGTECRVLEERPGWVEVELGGGTREAAGSGAGARGWIRVGVVVRAG